MGVPRDLVRHVVVRGRRLRAPRVGRLAAAQVLDGPAGDVLVEVGVPVPTGGRALVVGSDPYDDRVTCLADVRLLDSLPPGAFDVIALTDARPVRSCATIENAYRALRPGGVLVCGSTWPAGRALRRRFDHVRGHGIGPWRVVEARRGRDGDG